MMVMVTVLSVLLVLSLAAVLAVLMTGVVTFARGGAANQRHANRLMNLRVATQALAVLLLALIVLVRGF